MLLVCNGYFTYSIHFFSPFIWICFFSLSITVMKLFNLWIFRAYIHLHEIYRATRLNFSVQILITFVCTPLKIVIFGLQKKKTYISANLLTYKHVIYSNLKIEFSILLKQIGFHGIDQTREFYFIQVISEQTLIGRFHQSTISCWYDIYLVCLP